jgi:tetratricopeptide (TPR) repeat protein/transcriptional regulator with XRE-family HTH domain
MASREPEELSVAVRPGVVGSIPAAPFRVLLRRYREAALLSQDALAERAGLSPRAIRDLEAGRVQRPHGSSVRLLAQALGLQGSPREAFETAAISQLPARAARPSPSSGRKGEESGPVEDGQVSPFQLPPDVTDFTGRDELVAGLCGLLAAAPSRSALPDGVAVATIAGRAGAGKTALAVHVGHRLRGVFPDGQLYVQLAGAHPQPLDPGEVLGRFLRALGVDGALVPGGVQERAGLFRARTAHRRLLVVLDDAASEAQVRPLLPSGPGCRVLVTSRRPLVALEGARLVDLDGFDLEQALELLARIIGLDRVAAEPAAARAIVNWCGRLPLAVRIAGARLLARPRWPLVHLAGRLGDERRRLDELAVGDLEVRASVALTYQGLDRRQRRAFCRLGLLEASDFSAWAAAALLDLELLQAEELLEALVDARLLEAEGRDQTGQLRYRFHDLIGLFARECAVEEPEADRRAALERALGGWLALTEQANRRLPVATVWAATGHAGRWHLHEDLARALVADPLAWFEAERHALVTAVVQAARLGLDELSWGLAVALTSFFDLANHRDDWERTHQAALAAARRAGNRRGEAYLLLGLGELHALGDERDLAMACYEPALSLFRQARDAGGEAHTLNVLSRVFQLGGRYDDAMAYADQALRISRQLGDPLGEGNALLNAGRSRRDLGQLSQARQCVAAAQRIFQQAGDRRREGQAWRVLGMLHQELGQLDHAARCLRRALIIFRELDDRRGEAFTLENLAELHLVRGSQPSPREALEDCLAIFCEVGDRLGESLTLRSLGWLHYLCDEHDRAVFYLAESLQVGRALGYQRNLARTLQILGTVHTSAGNQEAAQSAWAEARSILNDSGLPLDQ